MTTVKQEDAFIKAIAEDLPRSLLGTAMDWIRDNLTPGELYGQDRVNQYVGQVATPEEVFTEEELKAWAMEKGYIAPVKPSLLSYGEQPTLSVGIPQSVYNHFQMP